MRRRVNRVSDPLKRLRAVGDAYIHFAMTQPGLFRTAFTSDSATSRGEDARTAGPRGESPDVAEPFDILGEVLDAAQEAGLVHPRRRSGAEIAVWSAVHGLACLLLDGPLPADSAGVKFATKQVFALIEHGLLNANG